MISRRIKLKRKIAFIIIGLFITKFFALTPHINKGKIEELTLIQGMDELKLSEKELKDINKEFFGVLEVNKEFPPVMEVDSSASIQIYKQTFDETNEIIYRVISYTTEGEPFNRSGIFQKGYYSNGKNKPNLIFAEFYDTEATVFGQSVTSVKYNYNFMPVIKRNKIAGIMIYGIEQFDKLNSIVEDEGSTKILYHKAAVYWKDDFSIADLRKSNRADIYIDCSKPLIDKNDTFKYTIQNAFDKNPSTSYVEDTDDDLFDINFIFAQEMFFHNYSMINGKSEILTGFSIINGYAANMNLYNNNNRIKQISITAFNLADKQDKETFLEAITNNYKGFISDNNLSYSIIQIPTIKLNSITFSCSNIYEGKKYKDTCLAEFELISLNSTNIFGD